ncbi:MAG TPA: hypothetical protein VFK82_06470 [Burkholderiaceae bacterium]|nr:hypothetical protein [Burkholderiaceae bacterium]
MKKYETKLELDASLLEAQTASPEDEEAAVLDGPGVEQFVACDTASTAAHAFWDEVTRDLEPMKPRIRRPFELDPDLIIRNVRLIKPKLVVRHMRMRNTEVIHQLVFSAQLQSEQSVNTTRSARTAERLRRRLLDASIQFREEAYRGKNPGDDIRFGFEFDTVIPCGIRLSFDYLAAQVDYRIQNIESPGLRIGTWPADFVDDRLMEELARWLLDQPHGLDITKLGGPDDDSTELDPSGVKATRMFGH